MNPEPQASESDLHSQALINSLNASQHEDWPYDYWLLDNTLADIDIDAVAELPFVPPENPDFDGTREANNAKRIYFNDENQKKFDVCRRLAEVFKDPRVIDAIEKITGADLSDTQLRMEYCQDTDGFWIAPHKDISAKKFTMLIYVSDDPGLKHTGTDIYQGPPENKHVRSVTYEKNKSLVFVPGDASWHGLEKAHIDVVRKLVIVNYVSMDWRATWELS